LRERNKLQDCGLWAVEDELVDGLVDVSDQRILVANPEIYKPVSSLIVGWASQDL